MRTGVGLSAVSVFKCSLKHVLSTFQAMPLAIPLAYYFLMPHPVDFSSVALPSEYEDDTHDSSSGVSYTPIPTAEIDDEGGLIPRNLLEKTSVALTLHDKWRLVKPLLPRYMLPLCTSHPYFLRTKILT